MKNLDFGEFRIGEGEPLAMICGPCVIESEDALMRSAEWLKNTFAEVGIPLIFKASYDKANRTSLSSYRGPGLEAGLAILQKAKEKFDLLLTTDVHSPEEAKAAAEVVDLLQIPAFLSRQTDLLVAAAETGKAVSVKKGQFMAPWDMRNVVDKLVESGNDRILLIDRGVSFGYNNLVSDMRAMPIMRGFGFPACFDATHSVQLPGGLGGASGGQREFIPVLARAAVAAGADALFMEAHPDPERALSDAASQIPFAELKPLLLQLKRLHEVLREPAAV